MARGEDDKLGKYPLAAIRNAREACDSDFLLASLTSANSGVREAAARSLGVLQEAAAVDPLMRLLVAREPGMRVIAAKALGKIADPRAADALHGVAVEDAEPGVRTSAMTALLKIGDRRAIPLVADVLTDPDLEERFKASSMRPRGSARYARRWARRTLRQEKGIEALSTIAAAAQRAEGIERWRLRKLTRSLKRLASPR